MAQEQRVINRKLWAAVKDRPFIFPHGDATKLSNVEWETQSFAEGIPIMKDPDAWVLWWVKYCYIWLGRALVLALLDRNPKWADEIKRGMIILPTEDGSDQFSVAGAEKPLFDTEPDTNADVYKPNID